MFIKKTKKPFAQFIKMWSIVEYSKFFWEAERPAMEFFLPLQTLPLC